MKRSLLLLIGILALSVLGDCKRSHREVDFDDNEFAEFEDEEDVEMVQEEEAVFPDEIETPGKSQTGEKDQRAEEDEEDEGMVETEDDEYDIFTDNEEFEGFDREMRPGKGKSHETPSLNIAKVPLHLRTNWDSFYLEMLMLAGLGVYFLNFLAGKTKNNKLAQAWFTTHKQILEENFAIVGDDGTSTEVNSGTLMKDSENVYALWCSGRTCVEGMLVELKLLKRQDLIHIMAMFFKPASDQIVVKIDLDPNVMDKYCFCIANKKVAGKLHKELNDLSQFTDKKNTDKYNIPSSFNLLSEIQEASAAILDKKTCLTLTEHEDKVEYIHISDQYSGAKQQMDEAPTKMPDVKPMIICSFNVPGKGKTKVSDMEKMMPLMKLCFHLIDKVSRISLSKEASQKAERNRQKAEEVFLKNAHAQRQEAAQLRREEKRRQEKEKMLAEEDPDKARKLEPFVSVMLPAQRQEATQLRREEKKRQEKEKMLAEEDPDKARKLEERENKRDMKKKQGKMKMMKVKAM